MPAFSSINYAHQVVLLRVDFNVPLDKSFNITDDSRMTASMPTITHLLKQKAKVVIMSHLGRPEGKQDKYSLLHLVNHLQNLVDKEKIETEPEVYFTADCIGADVKERISDMPYGSILLLENVRFYKEEEAGDENFAKTLASYGTIYVNDAFGTAHRAHASTAIIAKHFDAQHKAFGLLMEAEVNSGKKVMDNPQAPFTAIIGGAKVSDKILIIENLLNKVNNIIIGGGMSFTFLKALKHNIGKSLCENDKLDLALSLLEKAKAKNVNFLLPVDVIIADKFANDANTKEVDIEHIESEWMGLDIGNKSIDLFSEVIKGSKTILWNGPMGVFEMSSFQKGTKSVAYSVAEATKNNGSFSLIGGGDSVAAINQFNLKNQVSYVSTGGGALLELFEGKTLPGIAAIEKK